MSSIRYRRRVDHRPSPTLAFAVSLLVHTLLVLVLYEAYTEIVGAPLVPLQIVARDTSPRRAETLSLAVRPESEDVASKDVPRLNEPRRPTVQVPSLPRELAALDRRLTAVNSVEPSPRMNHIELIPGPRRTTAHASLPPKLVEMPAVADGQPTATADSPAAAPPVAPLERSDILSMIASSTAPETPPRIASRPLYGSPVHRQTGLAMLPTADVDSARPARQRRPADAFAQRGTAGGTPPEAGAAIELGLEFLARVQLDDGRWRFDDLRGAIDPDAEPVSIRADAAATGLALMAFLGAGRDHFDGRYHRVIQDALDYLVRVQQDSGALFPDDGLPTGQVTRFYGHGIATLALCEAYGMTGDPELYPPAQQALDYLAATQHPGMGGWRYLPGVNTDLSVTGWQLVALRSGHLAGLAVRAKTLARVGECLQMCRDENRPELFRYNPWASPTDPLTRHGRQPSTVMTSVGLLMELYLGGSPSDERLQSGAEHLLANLPQIGDLQVAAPIGTLTNPQRDTYYWYYGTLVTYHLGGDAWQAWFDRLQPLLVESQEKSGRLAGSWDPLHPVPDKWAAYGGRLYVTALNLLSLEVHERHLPLVETADPQIARKPE